MNGIKIRKENWIKYCDAVGDHNPIHRDSQFVKESPLLEKLGAKDAFAPGMYLASFIQGWPFIQSIRRIEFLPDSFVYDGDKLSLTAFPNRLGKSIDYVLSNNEKPVCNISGVLYGKAGERPPKPLKEINYTYETKIRPSDISYYLDSMSWHPEGETFPNMYLASLSAPALLDFGSKKDFIGVHISQSFESHYPFKHGPLQIQIGNERIKKGTQGSIHSYDMQAIQDGKIIASYNSKVAPLADIIKGEVPIRP
jgi:hypothetical protein